MTVAVAPRLVTIGIYGFTLERFLLALHDAGVVLLIDVRQRRGVRGPDCAWANSLRLQRALAEGGIDYLHRKDLAPSDELRRLQYREDARLGEGKRSRTTLAAEYRERYTREVLDSADLDSLAAALPSQRGGAALLCVEQDPRSCHRSLLAERCRARYGAQVGHLVPGG